MTTPDDWTTTTIGDVCVPVTKHKPENDPDKPFTYIDISSISEQRIVSAKTLDGRDAPSRARQLVRSGDTVLSTVRTYLRNTAWVPPQLDGATASTGFCVLRPGPTVDPRFLFHRVSDQLFVNRLSESQTGSSYPAVRDKDVRAMPLSLPPLPEQKRIVEAIEEQFSRLDAAQVSLDMALSRLRTLRSAWLEDALRDGDLVELSDVAVGLRYGTSVKCSYEATGMPVLRIPNIQRGRVEIDDLKFATEPIDGEAFGVADGDLLFVRTNGSRNLIGRVACLEGMAEFAFASYLIRARLDQARVLPRFAVLALSTPRQRRRIEDRAATTAGQYNLNLQALRSLPISIPKMREQRRIVERADRDFSVFDSVVSESGRAQLKSASLRNSILAEAFAGTLLESQYLAREKVSA